MPLAQTIRFLISDFLIELFEFPVWWYTVGLRNVIRLIFQSIQRVANSLRLPTLFRFLLTPMFGLRDWVSRIISFGVRIVHFCLLVALSICWTIVLFALFIVWLVLPIIVIYSFLFHLGFFELFDAGFLGLL